MASSSLPLGDLYSDEWVPPEHATEEEIKELIADRNYEKHGRYVPNASAHASTIIAHARCCAPSLCSITRHPTRSAFEAEDVHWLNSREAANKAFEKAIAREDRCRSASFQSL